MIATSDESVSLVVPGLGTQLFSALGGNLRKSLANDLTDFFQSIVTDESPEASEHGDLRRWMARLV